MKDIIKFLEEKTEPEILEYFQKEGCLTFYSIVNPTNKGERLHFQVTENEVSVLIPMDLVSKCPDYFQHTMATKLL